MIFPPHLSDNVVGAHAKGSNTNKLGICLVGNFEPGLDTPTAAQLTSLKQLLAAKGCEHGVEPTVIAGHRERGTTTTVCPGQTLFDMLDEIAREATQILAADTVGCDSSLDLVDCTPPVPLDSTLGTCTDGTNTGHCIASASTCTGAGGISRAAGSCANCCFRSTCGCHEDPNDPALVGSPALGDCTSSTGASGKCIVYTLDGAPANTTLGSCPSGDTPSNRCPDDPTYVRCCINAQPTCNQAQVAAIVTGMMAAGGISSYGVVSYYKRKAKAGGEGDEIASTKPRTTSAKGRSESAKSMSEAGQTLTATLVGDESRPDQLRRRSSGASKSSKASKASKGTRASSTSVGSRTSKSSKAKKSRKASKNSRSKSIGSRSSTGKKARSSSTASKGSRGSTGKRRSSSAASKGSAGSRGLG